MNKKTVNKILAMVSAVAIFSGGAFASPDVYSAKTPDVTAGAYSVDITVSEQVSAPVYDFAVYPQKAIEIAKAAAEKTVTVRTEKQLKSALSKKNVSRINISTDNKVKFTIPKNAKTGADIVVNAPDSTLINNSKNALSLRIKAVNTYTESGTKTSALVTADVARIILGVNAKSVNIKLETAGAKIKLTVKSEKKNTIEALKPDISLIITDDDLKNTQVSQSEPYVGETAASGSTADTSGVNEGGAAGGAGLPYTTKTVWVYRDSYVSDETEQFRYYEGHGDIPYMGIDHFLTRFMNRDVDILDNSSVNGSYLLRANDSGVEDYYVMKMFDVTDTVEIYHPVNVFDYYYYTESGEPLRYYYQNTSSKVLNNGTVQNIDLRPYNIDIIADGDDIYFPFGWLSIMSGLSGMEVSYNGVSIYTKSQLSVIQPNSVRYSKGYYNAIDLSKPRSEAEIRESYGELCFYIDNIYGAPSRNPYATIIEKHGLDQFLTNYFPYVRSLIRSEDISRYVLGVRALLGNLLSDGHTYLYDKWFYDYVDKTAMNEAEYKALPPYDPVIEKWQVTTVAAADARPASIRSGYYTEGDTAIISFDYFNVDYKGWDDFYKGKRTDYPKDMNTDTYGFVMSCIEKAKADPAIKNVVIDLTSNAGGYVVAGLSLVSLIGGKAIKRDKNSFNGLIVERTYMADKNLDGVIDSKDENFKYDLNFALLVSGASFSCASNVASCCRENGILIIGETTGGGSCTVNSFNMDLGLNGLLSGLEKAVNKNLDDTDTGVVPDVVLRSTDEQGNPDYSAYFDMKLLSEIIGGYYG